ncbi:hypothetical protein [Schaalia suimastitidis]|uniref:hypothetical protein n=1 Tax=Schaalia suimastitidis TaxID=121163 RepID=UPI0003F8F3A5|nr:hypothetical protein [Schaalia suimastitidis]
MIGDSVPWKEELLKVVDNIERRANQQRWTERTGFLVERDVMVGSFAVRKMLDTPGKISDETRQETVSVVSHRLVGQPPDLYNRFEFWTMFNVELGTKEELSLREFCNRIIHSLVFSFSAPENDIPLLDGIYVASDRSSRKSLTFISVEELLRVFRKVGDDDVVSVIMRRDAEGRMQVIRASQPSIEPGTRNFAPSPDEHGS